MPACPSCASRSVCLRSSRCDTFKAFADCGILPLPLPRGSACMLRNCWRTANQRRTTPLVCGASWIFAVVGAARSSVVSSLRTLMQFASKRVRVINCARMLARYRALQFVPLCNAQRCSSEYAVDASLSCGRACRPPWCAHHHHHQGCPQGRNLLACVSSTRHRTAFGADLVRHRSKQYLVNVLCIVGSETVLVYARQFVASHMRGIE